MVKFLLFSLLPLVAFCLLAQTVSAQTVDYQAQARALVAKMTLEEKAGLCSGRDFWSTKPVTRLNIPSIFMTDGPHGLRKAAGTDFANSVPATCFPTASALASSWNPELLRRVGVALGEECQANDVQILLGPGVNMKRSPLGGRNFEYFAEDPRLAGEMAAALITGVQSQGVGTSLKHFAVNNQEFERMTNSSDLDERTLHELYLPAFEIAVTKAQPWTVMCAYNKLNGVYCSENELLLTDILRRQWGFRGFVVSDWGAVNERPAGVAAGLNLEMPGGGLLNDQKIVAAVRAGTLPAARLDAMATELLAVILQAHAARKPGAAYDQAQHHALARQTAAECIVLLKNEGGLLPLDLTRNKKIAVLGAFAQTPRYQGAGSSQVRPTQLSSPYNELAQLVGTAATLQFAPGYTAEATTDETLLSTARQQAQGADLAIVFVGLPDIYESEGYDRTSLDLPAAHNRLVEAVAQVQPNVVVVLMNGSAVTMPWAAQADAIVEGWLGGQAGGGALADVLTGRVNPSGKLSETFPARLEDTPAFLDFPGQHGSARYGEGLFIGYRYYDKKQIKPLFPFGYGLSYTTFAYEKISTSTTRLKDSDPLVVEVTVQNTGAVAGQEVVQLYLQPEEAPVQRPAKELKHFVKVALQPGERKTVRFELGFRDFAYYDPAVHDWQVNTGAFTVLAGGSSADLPLRQTVQVEATRTRYPPLTRNSMVKEFSTNPRGQATYQQLLALLSAPPAGAAPTAPLTPEQEEARRKSAAMMMVFMQEMPVYKVVGMSQGKVTDEMLDTMLKQTGR